jgi:hypothetical protein
VTQLSCHLSKEIAVSFLLAMSHSHLSLKFSPPLFYRGTQISIKGPLDKYPLPLLILRAMIR